MSNPAGLDISLYQPYMGKNLNPGSVVVGGGDIQQPFTLATTGQNALALTGAPINTATVSLLQLSGPIASGNTASNGGTLIGANLPASGAGSAADLMNLQANGTSELKLTAAGALTVGASISAPTVAGTTSMTTPTLAVTGAGGLNLTFNNAGTGTGLNRCTVTLTAAQIIAMVAGTTPFQLLAGVATKSILLCSQVLLRNVFATAAFTGGGVITLTSATGGTVLTGSAPATALTTLVATGTQDAWLSPAVATGALLVAQGEGVFITNATSAFAGGSGTLTVDFLYRLL